jgi:hypothetical protein
VGLSVVAPRFFECPSPGLVRRLLAPGLSLPSPLSGSMGTSTGNAGSVACIARLNSVEIYWLVSHGNDMQANAGGWVVPRDSRPRWGRARRPGWLVSFCFDAHPARVVLVPMIHGSMGLPKLQPRLKATAWWPLGRLQRCILCASVHMRVGADGDLFVGSLQAHLFFFATRVSIAPLARGHCSGAREKRPATSI